MSDRRNFLRKFVAAGLVSGLSGVVGSALAATDSQGIRRISGKVSVNGKVASIGQMIRPGDSVSTGPQSEVIYVIGQDAFLQRDNTTVSFLGETLVNGLRIATGKLLSVFGKGQKKIQTTTAVIGIRGTGCYIEAEEKRMYICLCYGEADLAPVVAPEKTTRLITRHHETPVWISAEDRIQPISKAPMINHEDAELALLESLVGRVPPLDRAY